MLLFVDSMVFPPVLVCLVAEEGAEEVLVAEAGVEAGAEVVVL